eukprot:8269_1
MLDVSELKQRLLSSEIEFVDKFSAEAKQRLASVVSEWEQHMAKRPDLSDDQRSMLPKDVSELKQRLRSCEVELFDKFSAEAKQRLTLVESESMEIRNQDLVEQTDSNDDQISTLEESEPDEISNDGTHCSESPSVIASESFSDMLTTDQLLQGVNSHGFERPSPLQQRVIPAFLSKSHLLVHALAGEGKTAAFCVGALQCIDVEVSACQVLVVVPTRVLGLEIFAILESLGRHMTGLRCHTCVGGTSVRQDVAKFSTGQHVVVGTPGRIKHMVGRRKLRLESLTTLVLDDADELLSDGFKAQIFDILEEISPSVQLCLFSDNLDPEIMSTVEKFMNPRTHISVRCGISSKRILQFYCPLVNESCKFGSLCDLLEVASPDKVIIYCESTRTVNMLADRFRERGQDVIHEQHQMEPEVRLSKVEEFRSSRRGILVSNDRFSHKSARLLGVSLVVNYDVPKQKQTYLARLNQIGDFNKTGVVINLVDTTGQDATHLSEIEKCYCTEILELPSDTGVILEPTSSQD